MGEVARLDILGKSERKSEKSCGGAVGAASSLLHVVPTLAKAQSKGEI